MEEINDVEIQYRTAKNDLKKEINKSKKQKWVELRDDLNNDIWGKAYQIVFKKFNLGRQEPVSENVVDEQFNKLFPRAKHINWNIKELDKGQIPLFKSDDLDEVMEKLKLKKAPGLDGITVEILKQVVNENKQVFLKVMNGCLLKSNFPTIWKTSRLVLLEKPTKLVNSPISYRPICLIDSCGKLLEGLIRKKLQTELEDRHLISEQQYFFRTKRSTVNAIEKVQDTIMEIRHKAIKNRENCVMILIDIENAFNSAPWDKIVTGLQNNGISTYFINMVMSYLTDRKIQDPLGKIRDVTCGVPQGSILGPTLWNAYYDDVLRIDKEDGVEFIAYNDDLAVLVKGYNKEVLENKSTRMMVRIMAELESMGLKVAVRKTEVVLLQAKRRIKDICIDAHE